MIHYSITVVIILTTVSFFWLGTYCGPASNSNKISGSSEAHGRRRFYMNGEKICNNLNGNKGCFHSQCNNLQVYLGCHGPHPRSQCTKNSDSISTTQPQSKNDQAPPPPPATVRIREIKGKNPPFIHSKFDRAETHPNKNFINYLINGLEQGFHTSIQEVPTSTFDWNAKI